MSESRPKVKHVPEAGPGFVRPVGDFRELFRYADGGWIPDDGQPDRAFFGLSREGWPYALYYRSLFGLDSVTHDAMSRASTKYGCCNGVSYR